MFLEFRTFALRTRRCGFAVWQHNQLELVPASTAFVFVDRHGAFLSASVGKTKHEEAVARGGGDELLAVHRELVARNEIDNGLVYLQVTRGSPGDRDFVFPDPEETPGTVVMFTQSKPDLMESPVAAAGIKVISVPDQRWARRDIKTVQLLYPSMGKMAAKAAGAGDAWFVEDGKVTEGTSNNAYIVKGGKIVTRELSNDILHGITRAAVLRYAAEAQMEVEERAFTIEEAQAAQAAPNWAATEGLPVRAYGMPAKQEAHVKRALIQIFKELAPGYSFSGTPLQHLRGTITPSGLHYEVHHGGRPELDPSQHELMIHGLVERPLKFDLASLDRYPMVSKIHFLECAGNSFFNAIMPEPLQAGCDMLHGLVSNSEWTGIPLSTLMDEAGIKPEGKWVVAVGNDAPSLARSIPMEKVMSDGLLALYQNGERH